MILNRLISNAITLKMQHKTSFCVKKPARFFKYLSEHSGGHFGSPSPFLTRAGEALLSGCIAFCLPHWGETEG